MSELVQGVKLKFELPFKIPTPVSFPFDSIGTFRPITRIPKYDYSLEKKIMKDISKRKQEDQYDQLRQAQQQLSMVDLIASRKSRHKGKEPDRNTAAFGANNEPNTLVRPTSEGGVSRPRKNKEARDTTSSVLPPPSSSATSPSSLSNTTSGQAAGSAVANTKDPAAASPGPLSQQQQQQHNYPAAPLAPTAQQGSYVSERPKSAHSVANSIQQSMPHLPDAAAAVATLQKPTASQPVPTGGATQSMTLSNSAVQTQPVIAASSASGVGYVASGQNFQRPPVPIQYLTAIPQQQAQQQMLGPSSSAMHQAHHQPPNNNPGAYSPLPSSGGQQPIMQTGLSPFAATNTTSRPQMFPGMASIPQPQHVNISSPDPRHNNRYSSPFGASPVVSNSAPTASSASIPTLPPKPDELKPHAHQSSGPSLLPSTQTVTAAPITASTSSVQTQFRHGYGPRVPPTLPKRRDSNSQDQLPPALPPKPFTSFSEFDYTSDGPGALGTSSQDGHVEQLNTLLSMGFSRPHAIHALEMYDYDVNMASNYLIDKSS
ncbi:hypothetical protein GGI23_003430 [Coemansia sp. RSA 2559]|nr:hypothetical protein GGI23_003430 [Coemansia sp. RSA 2559]